MPLIELIDDWLGYDDAAVLKGISLTIEAGDRVAVVGESGAGKSTLLKVIYGRCKSDAALVPQEHGLVPSLTVFHNVFMGRLHRHSLWQNMRNLLRPAQRNVEEVRAILSRLRLEDKLFTGAGELSGGQKQRTAVGRALYHPGDVLIADEPVSAVDEHQACQVLEILNGDKQTAILALHDRAMALRYADRIIGLKAGRIVLDAPVSGMTPRDLDHLYRDDG